MNIVLTTLNARYTHTSIGLRYLYANLKELQHEAVILEFTINESVQSIAERILDESPKIVGIGVYIWNATEVKAVIEIIKKVSPETIVVIGGPEVSYEPMRVSMDLADFIVKGEGDLAFYELCRRIYEGDRPERVIPITLPKLSDIVLPYAAYSDEDIANRYIYVEASRGCPFLCEFCLSSIDEKVRNFDLEQLLEAFEALWQRGVRNFKFIDRTFNLNMKFANALLDFFLSKEPPYFAHFEVIPDHFPESIKERMKAFPAGALQLEIGIQTLNPEIAENISRPLKLEKIKENIAFFENETKVHMHLDLIVGLPGETLESFGKNLDELCRISRSEIQIGILKKLSGTAMSRHDETYGMVYSDLPPYDILKNDLIDYKTIQKMKRFARFWDLVYNSGNFTRTFPLLVDEGKVFDGFDAFSEWVYSQTQSTWKISLDRLAKLLFEYLVSMKSRDEAGVAAAMIDDLTRIKGRKLPAYLKSYVKQSDTCGSQVDAAGANKRQQRRA
jgi:radical SAM superfamily enzyme YgiQ (UPF0313 family)